MSLSPALLLCDCIVRCAWRFRSQESGEEREVALNKMPLMFHQGITLTEVFSSVAFREPSVITLAQRAVGRVFVTELRD